MITTSALTINIGQDEWKSAIECTDEFDPDAALQEIREYYLGGKE